MNTANSGVTLKPMFLYRTITLLSLLFSVECAYGQIPPKPTLPPPKVPIVAVVKEVYSDWKGKGVRLEYVNKRDEAKWKQKRG